MEFGADIVVSHPDCCAIMKTANYVSTKVLLAQKELYFGVKRTNYNQDKYLKVPAKAIGSNVKMEMIFIRDYRTFHRKILGVLIAHLKQSKKFMNTSSNYLDPIKLPGNSDVMILIEDLIFTFPILN